MVLLSSTVIKFLHNGSDKTAFIINIGEIRRDINLTPGYVQVTVDNTTGEFDDYLTTDDYLTNVASITFGLSGFANVTMNTISFHNNGANPDTIEDSANQFILSGFKAGMVFEVSGSTANDDTYTIAGITAGVITLLATDALFTESAGDSVTLIAEELPLFTGYVMDADGDDIKNTILTIQDRLSVLLDNHIQIAPSIDFTANTIAFNENTPAPDTITDSGDGFLTAGLRGGMSIIISDSVSNDKIVSIASAEAGTLTLFYTDDLTDEGAGATVTLTTITNVWLNCYVNSTLYRPYTVSELVWYLLTSPVIELFHFHRRHNNGKLAAGF